METVTWLVGPEGTYRKDAILGIRHGGEGHAWLIVIGDSDMHRPSSETLRFGVFDDDEIMRQVCDAVSNWLLVDDHGESLKVFPSGTTSRISVDGVLVGATYSDGTRI